MDYDNLPTVLVLRILIALTDEVKKTGNVTLKRLSEIAENEVDDWREEELENYPEAVRFEV